MAFTSEQVERIVAAIRAGERVSDGGGRCFTSYYARDGEIFAEYFDEGSTDERIYGEAALRALVESNPGMFADILRRPALLELGIALRDPSPAGRSVSQQKLAEYRELGDKLVRSDILEATLRWPEKRKAIELDRDFDGNTAYHTIASALAYDQNAPAFGPVGVRFFEALDALRGGVDIRDFEKYRADFRERAGDLDGALADYSVANARKRDEDLERAIDRVKSTRFVQAIAAAPDDDTPRLVWADSLLERGNSRGELIIEQCAAARLDTDDGARLPLEARAKQLIAKHGEEWAGLREARFARGGVDSVAVRWTLFAREAEQIFAVKPPIRELRLTRLPNESMEQPEAVLDDPRLSRLDALDLGDPCFFGDDRPEIPFGPAALERLRGRLPQLRSLAMRRVRITPEDAEAIAARASLTSLALAACDVRDLVAPLLGGVEGLRHLKLSSTELSTADQEAIAKLARLDSLDLSASHCFDALMGLRVMRLNLSHTGVCAVAGVVGLRALDLSYCGVDHPVAATLADLELTSLRLDQHACDAAGLDALLGGRLASTLQRISLAQHEGELPRRDQAGREEDLAKNMVRLLAKAPKLWDVDLRGCELGTAGACALLDALPRLRSLWLGDCGIDDLAPIVRHPRFSQLEFLGLDGNRLGDAAGQAFTSHMPARLVLADNGIGDAGVRALLASPAIDRLVELDLSHNDVTDDAAKPLVERPWFSLRLVNNRLSKDFISSWRNLYGSRATFTEPTTSREHG